MKRFFILVSIFSLKFSEGKMTNRNKNEETRLVGKIILGKVTKFFASEYVFPRLNFNPILFNPDFFPR